MYQGKHNCTKMSKLSPSSGHCGTRSNLSKNRLICYDYHPHNVLGFKTRGKNYISRSVAFLQCFKNDFPKGLSQKLQHHHHFHRIQYFCFSLLSCNFSPVWLFFPHMNLCQEDVVLAANNQFTVFILEISDNSKPTSMELR